MDAITGLLTAGSGGLLGGLFGFATNWFKSREERAKIADDREFELKKWAREDKLFSLQAAAKQQDHENEAAVIAQQGSWAALNTSIASTNFC